MEAFLVLLGLAVIVGPWIFAIAGFVRAGRLAKRVELLERRMDLRAAAPGAVAQVAEVKAPVEVPLATTIATEVTGPLTPAPSPAGAGESGSAPESEPEQPAAPAAAPGTLEERIALVWLTRAGALVVLLGAATFFKYAVDNDWIPPILRVALGVLAGVAAIAGGEFLRPRAKVVWVNVVQGAGVALLFFSIFAAAALYALLPFALAFAAIAVITGAGCALALRGKSEVVLGLSLLGALAAPVLLSTGQDNPGGLLGWLLLASGATLAVSAKLGFRIVPWFALAGTALLFGGWYERYFEVYAPPASLDPDLPPEVQQGVYWPLGRRLVPLALAVAHVGAWAGFWLRARRPGPSAWPRLLGDVWLGLTLVAAHVVPFMLLHDRPLLAGASIAVAGLVSAVLAGRAERPAFHPAAALLGAGLLAAVAERAGWPGIGAAALWGVAHLAAAGRTLLAVRDEQPGAGLATGGATIAASIAGLGFAGLAVLATRPQQELLRAGLAGAAGAAELALGAFTLPRGRARATVLLGSALGLVAAAAAFLLSGASITVAWAALAAAVAVVAARERDPWWLGGAAAMFLLALGRAFDVDLHAVEAARSAFLASDGKAGALSARFLLNARGAGLAGTAVALFVAARAVLRAHQAGAPKAWRAVAAGLVVAAHGALLALLVAEARDLMLHFPPPPPAGDSIAFEDYRQVLWEAMSGEAGVADTAATVVMALYAAVLLVVGFVAREVLHRWLGLGLFAITLVKVLLSDVWRLGAGLRILVFMASGLLMLAAGFLYARYGKRILGLLKEPPPGAGTAALLLVAGLGAAPGLARAAEPGRPLDVAPYATERSLDGIAAPGLHAVRVDAALWQATRASAELADLRVAGPDGAEVPWALRAVAGPAAEEVVPATLVDPVALPDGAVRAVLDKGKRGLRTDELRLELEGDDFLRRARVETSDDGKRWGVLVDGPRVYAVPGAEGLEAVRHTAIAHPPSETRWLRVTLLPGAGKPRLLGASAVRRPSAPPPVDTLPLPVPPRIDDPARKTSRWDLDLGAAGVPFEAVSLAVSTPAFERRVRLLGSNDGKTWVGLGGGLVFRVPGDEALRVGAVRAAGRRLLRLEVRDGDAAPLELTRVTVEWPARELVIGARQGGPHRLLTGSATATLPAYDLPGILARSPGAPVTPASLGPAHANPGYRPAEAEVPFTEKYRTLFGAGLLVVLAGLGAFSMRLMKSGQGS
ncbi:MAG: DUF2339 domain-containing protein [Anaeromyxobacter sp.]